MATIERKEHNIVKLTIGVDAASFSAAIQQAYQKNGKHYNVPGFRKGHAPRKVIENMYGEGVFYEDAFELVWGKAYDAALDEFELEVVDRPTLDITKIGLDGVEFTAEVQLKPEVELGAYKGIEVEKAEYPVTDADVDNEIDREREKNARFIDVERPVENDDRVILDYSGSVDGVKFEGGTAEEQTLVIGSNTFIPGFEPQLIGMNAGEEKDITVTFPAEYHAAELAGKEAVFHCKIRQIQVKQLPEADDEFAKDISEFDTIEALRADKRAKLEESAKENEKNIRENRSIAVVCDNAKVEVPDCMIKRQTDYMLQDMESRMSMSGITLDDYCKYCGTTKEEIRANYKTEAETRVKMQLVIEAVGKAEGISCNDEELEQEIVEYAKQSGMEVEELRKYLSDDDKEYFRDRKIASKTVDFIVENAVFVEPKQAEKDKETTEKTEA